MKPTTKSGTFRYSNDGTTPTTTTTTTSSGSWNWDSFVSGVFNLAGTVLPSIFGKSDKYQAQAYQQMYNQQKQTTTVLWVVIGLVLALGVVLLIRKTK